MSQPILSQLIDAVHSRFQEARTILSFSEYLDIVHNNALRHCRNSAQYVVDAFRHYGSTTIETPWGPQTRHNLFDTKDENGVRVAGQEQAQHDILRLASNFVREGKITRLILLHGPNGSGKSSLLNALIQALQHYSTQEEGVLYRFNWIFPSEKLKRSGIGFGRQEETNLDLHSYAHLEGDQIEARIPSPLKDHPLLLLPLQERTQFFQTLTQDEKLPQGFALSKYLAEGSLSPRNRIIFDALLTHYNGNFSELLRHVQVERYYISQRYRTSAVTIEPQMHVDASLRQVTADRSMSALPKPLNNLSLFEPVGALVDANRGILEYSDLLKRPVEAFKYLLGTCETGRIHVEPLILFLDLILIGTANEHNLDQFKKFPEFTSFKSRIELIRVPYLMQYSVEKTIYDELLQQNHPSKPITPHTTELAALWAVLSRLRKPDPEGLPESLASLVSDLTPLEKAHLYNDGTLPRRYSTEEAKELRQHINVLFEESKNESDYEGRIGASPREIRTLLLNAAQNEKYPCLSPLALFEELEKLVQELSVYKFLQREEEDGYYDAAGFIEIVRQEHLTIVDREFRAASGLIQPDQYTKLLERYIQHVKAHLRNEKVQNPVTRASEEPDTKLMESVEEVISGEDAEQFRNDIISQIAVYSIEHPNEKIDIPWLFSEYIERLEHDAFSKQYKRLRRLAQHCLVLLMEDKPKLKADEQKEAKKTLKQLETKYGYSKDGAREQIALLMRKRYHEFPA